MQGNFIMLQKDDLKQVVSELVEELVGKKSQPDLTSEESDEYYTRDQVCERLHIPADTRSAFPVISVHSPVSIQYRWQS